MRTTSGRRAMLAMAAGSLLVAASCGDGGGDGAGGDASSEQDTSPIKVGVLFSTSGPLESSADSMLQGIDYWMSENPTILDREVELVVVDDGATPATAVPAAQRLLQQEEVDIVVGPYISGPSSAVLGMLNQANVVNVNLSAYADAGDAEQFPYTFHVEWSKDIEGQAMLDYACQLDATSIATIVVNNPLGTETDASISDNVDDAPCGIEYEGSEQFAAGSPDAAAQASAVKDNDVVVAGAATPADLAAIINSLNEVGFEGYVMGNAQLSSPPMADLVDAEVHDRIIAFGHTPQTERPLSPEAEEWLTGAQEFVGGEVPRAAYIGWDAMDLLKSAAEGADSLDPDAMKEWLESTELCQVHACMHFSESSHDGLTAEDARPVAFAAAVEGFAETFEVP